MSKSVKEIAMIAAEWWGEQVCNPKFDNGDTSLAGAFGSLLAGASAKKITEQQKSEFVTVLADYIEKELNEGKRPFLDNDYAPSRPLREAAEAAGISPNNFPWKTTVWLDKDHVAVSLGYRAKREFIYTSLDYWEKQIKHTEKYLEECKDGSLSVLSLYKGEEREAIRKERIEQLNKDLEEYKAELAKAEEIENGAQQELDE